MRVSGTPVRFARLSCLLLGAALALPAGAVDAPATAQDDLLLTIQADFHAARKWFGMVSDLKFDRHKDGSLAPRYDGLHSRFVLAQDPAGQSLGVEIPADTRGPLHVWLAGSPGVSVRTEEIDVKTVPVETVRGVVVYREAVAGGDLIYKLTPTHVDEYIYFRAPPETLVRRFDFDTGPGVSGLREANGYVEVLDRKGTARLRLSPPLARAADGARRRGTVYLRGRTIVEEIDLRGLKAPVLVDPDWTTTGTMTVAHWGDTAYLRPDGEVMSVGGCALSSCPTTFTQAACSQVIASTDVWTEGSGAWAVGAPMITGRYLYAGVPLADGNLLVAGGCTTSGCVTTTALAEIYTAASDSWSAAGSLSSARASSMGAVLPDGEVLVAGGCTPPACTADVDVYSEATNSFSSLAALPAPRGFATATALPDGRVLVVGGCSDTACALPLADALIYDPVADDWSPAGTMSTPRAAHAAAPLPGGQVLIAGGCADPSCTTTLSSAEIWSPSGGGVFTLAPPMLVPRHNHTLTALANGDVLVAGGMLAVGATSPAAEVYLPVAGYWYDTTGMIMDRAYHVAVALGDGKVLVAGGCNPATCIPFAEVYSPASLPPDVDGGMAPPPPDAGVGAADAGPPPVFTPASPHPALYRDAVVTCATSTAQDLTCPQPGYGLQDGEFQPDTHPLQKHGDEISDPATGLSWQVGDSGVTTQIFSAATTYCAAFSSAETPAGEWRVPSVVELFTILDHATYVGDPASDTGSTDPLFQGTQATNYWTSTLVAENTLLAWTVKFDYGEVIPLLLDSALPVRCVHGPPLQNASGKLRLAGNLVGGPLTVVDAVTGLEWMREDDGTKRTWQQALNACAELSLDGKSGWHLPNAVELFGLVEYDNPSTTAISIDPVFQNPKADLYWTSTQNEGVPTLSWSVNFNEGVVDGVTVTGFGYARCVRHWSPTPDAGPVEGVDAGPRDAGSAADAGSENAVAKSGCRCSGSGAGGWSVLALLILLRIRATRRSGAATP